MRIQLENPAGGVYVGMAKSWMAQLQRLRHDLRLPMLEKLIIVNNFRILVRASDWVDLIWITGGGNPHIIIANTAGDLFVYDYLTSTLTPTGVSPNTVTSLQQFFNRQNHLSNLTAVTDGVGATALDDLGTQLTRSLLYELEFLRKGNGIYTRGLETSGLITSLELSGVSWADINTPLIGDYVGLPVEVSGEQWNFYEGIITLGLPIASRNVQELFKWVPSIFYAYPGDKDYLPGWYYGRYNGWLGVGESISELTIDFISLLDTRFEEADTPFGYCERLTSVNGETDGTLNFFLSATPPAAPIDHYTYKSNTGYIHAGTLTTGYVRTFATNPYPGEEASADFWNFSPWVDPTKEDEPKEACGVVVFSGVKATVYRYSGVLSSIHSIENYHSHSVSTLGDKVALFHAEADVITAVTVIDLYGERFTDDDGVVTGPVYLLREAGNVEATAGNFGEWIPVPKVKTDPDTGEDIVSPTLPYSLGDGTTDSYTFNSNGMASLAVMSYPETGNGVVGFHNIIVDGTRATVSDTTDECFETVIVANPDPTGVKVNHIEERGEVAGEYGGTKDAVTFTALGAGTEIKREEPSVSADPSTGQVFISGFMGEIVSTENITENGFVDWSGGDDCSVTISATSSCGQTASSEVSVLYDELVVSVTYTAAATPPSQPYGSVGNGGTSGTPTGISATGGVPPYTYAMSCGSRDEETGELDTTGCCGTGTVTVTDACGNEATAEIRYPTGYWVSRTSDETTCPTSFLFCWGDASGGSIIRHIYRMQNPLQAGDYPNPACDVSTPCADCNDVDYPTPPGGGYWYTECPFDVITQVFEWACDRFS